MQLISGEKDWNHVSVQKVVTLNICCNVACLTFHLPHSTTSSFQSHQCQPTTGFYQSHQRLEECNIPSVRWKSCAFYQVVRWHFERVIWKITRWTFFGTQCTCFQWLIKPPYISPAELLCILLMKLMKASMQTLDSWSLVRLWFCVGALQLLMSGPSYHC